MQFNRAGAIMAALSFVSMFSAGTALAGEKTLEFQLVTKYIEPRTLEVKNVEDQTVTQAKAFGVAVFKDGRVGTKDFITVTEKQKGAGTGFGYSTYTFDDGSVTARFMLTFDAKTVHGDYKVLSGTGAHAGATGTGTFDSIPNPYTGDRLYKVTLRLVTP